MKLVKARGIPGELMIVGDYPTKNEYNDGYSFSGAVGRVLELLLAPYKDKIGKYGAQTIFKTHYVKVPVTGLKGKNKKQVINEILQQANWDAILKEQIDAVNPNVIIAMGELACRGLTGYSGVKNRRGSIYHTRDELSDRKRNVLVTLSIRDIFEENDVPFPYVQWDIGKAINIKSLKEPFKPKELIWIPRTQSELENWWERAKKGDYLVLDIETHNGFITCIGFSHDGYEAISIPLLISNVDPYTKATFYKLIKEILASPIPKVNQNIKYDQTILEKWGFQINNIVGDTMLMAHCIYSELPKGLDFLSSIYTDQPYYKDEGREYDPRIHTPERLLIYNAKDALVTHQIWRKQQEDAKALGVYDLFHKNVMKIYPIYKQMEERGLLVDLKKRQELYEQYSQLYSETCAFINVIAEERVNPASPKQCARLLYDILKLPPKTHTTPSGELAYSTDDLTIKELLVKSQSKAVRMILNKLLLARKVAKLLQYLSVPIASDGRLKASIKLHGTETGRTSGGKSLERVYQVQKTLRTEKIVGVDVGITFQNLPKHGFQFDDISVGKDLRKIFIPTPGYVFVEGDQSQAEARVVCVLADDFETLKLFDTADIHKITASWIYDKPPELITKEERQVGKKARHAGNYNMGPGELAHQTQKPIKECEMILNKFHSAAPKIRGVFHATIRNIIDTKRYLVTPHGRRRDFFGRVTEDMYKEAYATIPQATVSDHSKFTILVKMYEKFPPPLAYPLAEMHDGILFEVRNEIKHEFMDYFKEVIATPINFSKCSISRDYDLVIPGEISLGEISWGEMVEYK